MVMLYMKIDLFGVLGVLILKKSIFDFNKYITTRVIVTKTETKHQHIIGFLNRDIRERPVGSVVRTQCS